MGNWLSELSLRIQRTAYQEKLNLGGIAYTSLETKATRFRAGLRLQNQAPDRFHGRTWLSAHLTAQPRGLRNDQNAPNLLARTSHQFPAANRNRLRMDALRFLRRERSVSTHRSRARSQAFPFAPFASLATKTGEKCGLVGQDSYAYLQLSGLRRQKITSWLTLEASGRAQFSSSDVLPEDLTFLGGPHSVRGYFLSEYVGD
jgi:hypothetical protein